MTITTKTEEETIQAAQKLADEITGGDVIALYGDLGAGKTVFARSLIRALTNNHTLEVPSPTFTLVQSYESSKGEIFHFDLYRTEDPEDVYALGWEEALAEGIVIIEWPERLGTLKPAKSLDIRLSGVDNKPQQRKIEIIRT